ncbi:MAG: hypothetical protein RMZ43_016635 [Nostoc sp. CmiVER01]|nr:hypothetical protein [Nostoc sp. CmiVER01]MDZ8121106.1 hypothetical protein [Nostoc sp. CmiVER01]
MTQKLKDKLKRNRYMKRLTLLAAVRYQLQQNVVLAGINIKFPTSQIL